MDLHRTSNSEGLWSRIRSLRSTGAGSGKLNLTPAAAFTGVRMILGWFPSFYRSNRTIQDAVLGAFVLTVIPGADPEEANLVRMYHDGDYPFAPFSGFLVFDIVRRAEKLHGSKAFQLQSLAQRTAVIQDALAANDTVSRLYKGAMLMAQVSYFAGIYDPAKGCAMIDFPGANSGFSLAESSYPFAKQCFDSEMTNDGNPR